MKAAPKFIGKTSPRPTGIFKKKENVSNSKRNLQPSP